MVMATFLLGRETFPGQSQARRWVGRKANRVDDVNKFEGSPSK